MNINQYNKNTGKKIGYWESYYNNGKILSKGHYDNNENGKRVGYWEQYYYNGDLWYKGTYNENGNKMGYWEECWYNIIKKGNYINNQKIEYWAFYNMSGKLRKNVYYIK